MNSLVQTATVEQAPARPLREFWGYFSASRGALAGGWHAVTTGVCVRRGDQHHVFHVTTEVRFRALSDAEIASYLETGEADDKAGAYGIQGRGGAFVAELRGSWTNVMGLPVEETLAAIRAVADYACAHAESLLELDVNPLLVNAGGAVAVDALIRLQ